MKPKAFAALVVATAVSLVFAITTFASYNRWAQATATGSALFPGMAAQVGGVAKIEIKQGEKELVLARDKESWSLANRGGYPAKAETARTLLRKLAEAGLVEPKTRSKDRYALLDLEDPSGKTAKSRQVRLLDDKGGLLAEVVVGKKRSDAFGAGKSGTYVRKPGDDQTWLANADLDAPVTVREWVQPSVLALDAAKISGVTIEIPGEEPLKIERESGGGKYALIGIPDGRKLKNGNDIDTIVRAAASVDLDDVRKLEGQPAADAGVARIASEGGLAVTLRLRKDGEDTWLSVEAVGEGDAKKPAEDITRAVQGWEFKLPAAKAQSILKRRSDLLESS